jgi:hypothetical protein
MSRGRGRGRGNTSKSAFTGLQVDLQGTSLFPSEPTELFPVSLSASDQTILGYQSSSTT